MEAIDGETLLLAQTEHPRVGRQVRAGDRVGERPARALGVRGSTRKEQAREDEEGEQTGPAMAHDRFSWAGPLTAGPVR